MKANFSKYENDSPYKILFKMFIITERYLRP